VGTVPGLEQWLSARAAAPGSRLCREPVRAARQDLHAVLARFGAGACGLLQP